MNSLSSLCNQFAKSVTLSAVSSRPIMRSFGLLNRSVQSGGMSLSPSQDVFKKMKPLYTTHSSGQQRQMSLNCSPAAVLVEKTDAVQTKLLNQLADKASVQAVTAPVTSHEAAPLTEAQEKMAVLQILYTRSKTHTGSEQAAGLFGHFFSYTKLSEVLQDLLTTFENIDEGCNSLLYCSYMSNFEKQISEMKKILSADSMKLLDVLTFRFAQAPCFHESRFQHISLANQKTVMKIFIYAKFGALIEALYQKSTTGVQELTLLLQQSVVISSTKETVTQDGLMVVAPHLIVYVKDGKGKLHEFLSYRLEKA